MAQLLDVMRDEVAWMVVLGVFTFHLLVRAQKQTLLSLLVMACFAYAASVYVQKRVATIQEAQKDDQVLLDGESKWRKEAVSDRYPLASFPKKGFRYLRENDALVGIAKRLIIARMFDRGRYSDLLLSMDQLQKVYMYILDGRYHAKSQVVTFLDLRESVLEHMYSMYFVIPPRLKHVYGLDTYATIRQCTEDFMKLTRVMLKVLKSYLEKTAKEPYFPPTLPFASDMPFDPQRNRRLP